MLVAAYISGVVIGIVVAVAFVCIVMDWGIKNGHIAILRLDANRKLKR
jgi:hypothetical protein